MFHAEFQLWMSLSTGSAPHPDVADLGTGKRLPPRTSLSSWESRELCLSHLSCWEIRSPEGTAGPSTCSCLCCASATIHPDGQHVRMKPTRLSKATAEQELRRKILISISKVQGAAGCDHNSPQHWLDANTHRLKHQAYTKAPNQADTVSALALNISHTSTRNQSWKSTGYTMMRSNNFWIKPYSVVPKHRAQFHRSPAQKNSCFMIFTKDF